jgi:transcriptional regulator NrdR family protein
MICHQCQTNDEAYKTEVLETRERWNEEESETYIYRRRRCMNCGYVFLTFEFRGGEDE